MPREIHWSVDDQSKDEPLCLELKRPCHCGCDFREGVPGVGYLIGQHLTDGVTLWVEEEETYQRLQKILDGQNRKA